MKELIDTALCCAAGFVFWTVVIVMGVAAL